MQYFYQLEDGWYESPLYYNIANRTDHEIEYYSSLDSSERWNPILVKYSVEILGGTLVGGSITLGSVVGIGAIAAAGAYIWKLATSTNTVKETQAGKRSEDIFVDINETPEEINEFKDDPNDLEQRAMHACVNRINRGGRSGGCCRTELCAFDCNQICGNTLDNAIVGFVEAGVQLSCPQS